MKLKKLILNNFLVLLSLTLVFLNIIPLFSQVQNKPQFQLVESIPLETGLGSGQTSSTLQIWLEMIDSARKNIDMEIFYLSHKSGEPLEQVIRGLERAADRGVIIRIIADARMAGIYPEMLDSLNQHPNIDVRKITVYNDKKGVMHAKYFLVDDEELFLGSQNMDWRALTHIHELGVRIHHPRLTQTLKAIFETDWELTEYSTPRTTPDFPVISAGELINRDQPALLLFNSSDTIKAYPTASFPELTPAGISHDEDEIIRLIDSAREQVEVQLLSYRPASHNHFYEALDIALRKAAARGVGVRMIVSNWNTGKYDMPYLKSLQVIPNIEIRISTIPEHSGGFIPFARVEHCKFMVVDSLQLWLGTSNWSWNNFHTSRNLGLVITNRKVNQICHEIFQKSWTSAYCQTVNICRDYIPPVYSAEEN